MVKRHAKDGGRHVPDPESAASRRGASFKPDQRFFEETTMALANILVHLDSRPRTAARLGLSLRIAERCGARLTGMFAERAEAHVVGTVATWPSERYVAARDKAQAAFAAATAPLEDRAAFIDVNRGSDHEIVRRATEIARAFDLVVLGQAQDDVPVPAKLPDEVIAESGRPVLVVPYVGTYADVGARPLFAWHGERGAARAAFDALPLVTNGCEALIVEVGHKGDQRYEFSDLLVANLARHKVDARYQHVVVEDISVSDALLSAISDHSADLMAIGAFDAGWRFLFGHGSGTPQILAHMTAPVLFSH
jgi:nucleotide-binding universal stress UspA family protein